MSFIRDLYFFIRLFVLLLFVRQRLCAECEHDTVKVEKKFYELFKNELSKPSVGKILELLECQYFLIQTIESVLAGGDYQSYNDFEEKMMNVEMFLDDMISVNDTSSLSIFTIPALMNQLYLYPYYGYPQDELRQKITKIKEHLELLLVFKQFEKLNLGNTNAEGSSNQSGSLNKLCSAVAQNCFRAVHQFEEKISWSTLPIVFNTLLSKEANEIGSKAKYLPSIKCSSQNLEFYITSFTSQFVFLLQAGDGDGSDAKLIAFTEMN